MDIEAFRAALPEFSDTSQYPDAMVTMWAGSVEAMLLPVQSRWLDQYDTGFRLALAHFLALARRQALATAGGMGVVGSVSSKSIGSASVSYDTSNFSLDNAGHWNLTLYGIQFRMMVRMIGAGGVQL